MFLFGCQSCDAVDKMHKEVEEDRDETLHFEDRIKKFPFSRCGALNPVPLFRDPFSNMLLRVVGRGCG
ncbi:hypothetical protein CEXT_225741 [Caerostris extrusa]|uniref:Uncharacterized protein n=1 Tax=Caerostris extrusa TaxID=172846 RepID=A0AAV4YC00_CAEEX|nr:hypothetical protein CEXT_225741 [Caerostris extrusa]